MDEHNDRYLHRLFIEVYLGDDMDSPTLEPLLSMRALNSHPRDRRNNISCEVCHLSLSISPIFFSSWICVWGYFARDGAVCKGA